MDRNSKRWLFNFEPRPSAELTLFCFHYAGGSALTFQRWESLLPPDIQLCAIQLPGRANRFNEKTYLAFPELIDDLTIVITPLLHKPFAFFGHSLGSFVAYELAKHLFQFHSLSPAHLFVAARAAPHLKSLHAMNNEACKNGGLSYNSTSSIPTNIAALTDEEIVQCMRRLGGIPDLLLADTAMLSLFLPTLKSDLMLLEGYQFEESVLLPCAITAFGGSQDLNEVSLESLKAWRDLTSAVFSFYMIPGGHFFIHDSTAMVTEIISAKLGYDVC